MIRLATTLDVDNILRMSKMFFDKSGYSDISTFNEDDSKEIIFKLIGLGTLLTDGKHGMIGFVMFPLFMNKSTVMSQELFWWVDEEARGSSLGIRLLKEAELISSESGATVMNMLALSELEGDKMCHLYKKLGYIKKEQSYMRIL